LLVVALVDLESRQRHDREVTEVFTAGRQTLLLSSSDVADQEVQHLLALLDVEH
jgi:hypothetical protein